MSSALQRNPMRVALACAWLLIGGAGWAAVAQNSVPLDEGRRMFDAGVARYAALRATLEESLPAFDDPRRDPWSLLLSRRYLASAIRAARHAARPGSIFTPAAALWFRETIARAVYEIDIEGLVDVLPGEGAFALDLAVNEPIPAWALAPAPAALVERLPPLPAAIEYRIAGGALVLWDTHAEILIDALADAFVAP